MERLGVIRHKIWYDLWENRARTARVVAIIAIGAFAVGTVWGAKEFILKDVFLTWQASSPAIVGLIANPPVDDTMINSLAGLDEIETVVGWLQNKTIRWRNNPGDPWQSATLIALDEYNPQIIRKVTLDSGEWPQRKLMGVQRDRQLGAGDHVQLNIKDKVYSVELNGVLYNAAHPSAFVSPDPVFYTTRERFAQLIGSSDYNLVLATISNFSEAKAEAAADLLQHELEKQGIQVEPAMTAPGGLRIRTGSPDRFTGPDMLDSVLLVLSFMAVAMLVLGLFLVYNTINAIIVQQVNQIGMMKAIGARFSHILFIYLSLVAVYALLALAIAVPLGALGAHILRVSMMNMIGIPPGSLEVSTTALAVQSMVAVLSPLLIAILPIFSGARVTVREAISTYGLGNASGPLDWLLVRLYFIPRIVSLTLGNTFRNKKRVFFTQITLVGAGVIFMMVMNTRASLTHTFGDVILSIFRANVMLELGKAERITKLETLTLAHPEVKSAEIWGAAQGMAHLQDRPSTGDDSAIHLRGMPVPSNTYIPQVQAGRWLQAEDEYAMVLNQEVAKNIGAGVGEWVTVDIPTKGVSDWQVVGLLFEPVDQEVAIVPRESLLREIHQAGRGVSIQIKTLHGDAETEAAVAGDLRATYEKEDYEVLPSIKDTSHRLAHLRARQMNMVFGILSGMAIMTALVGAVALSGTLAINVMERSREIGVMRAIGASAGVIAGQFIGEGLILGWLSWLLAIPLAVSAGRLFIKAMSGVLHIELTYQVSQAGIWYWFIAITVLSAIASWFPAQKAAQASVRESLAYV
jgi:putative ABC transport system permease protein